MTPLACGWKKPDPRFLRSEWLRKSRRARVARVVREAIVAVLTWGLMGGTIAWGALLGITLWARLGLPLVGGLEHLR